MKLLGEIKNPHCLITYYEMGHNYIVKLEHDSKEQVISISKWDARNEEELFKIIDDDFIVNALKKFNISSGRHCG